MKARLTRTRPRSLHVLSAAIGAVAGVVVLACPLPSTAQEDAPRPAAEIIRDFHRVDMPSFSGGNTPEAIAEFKKQIDDGCREQGRFALELYRGHPDHPRTPDLLFTRWAGMSNALGESEQVVRETAEVVEGNAPVRIKRVAWCAMARAVLLIDGLERAERRKIVLRAAEEAPGDEQAGYQLLEYARLHCADPDEMTRLVDRVIAEYGDTQWAGPEAKIWRQHLDRLGTAHSENFEDFRDGTPFDSSRAGGPIIVHYWSPGSDGIEREVERLRALIDRYGDRGLRVVGVHNGRFWKGRDALVEWAGTNRVTWPLRLALPQEGKSPWETGVRVPRVPFALLLDAEGKIRMLSTRVESLVPTLERWLADPSASREAL